MGAPAIEALGIRYSVGGRTILGGVDLALDSGQSIAITGPSGSGKTTLLMCLAGIIQTEAGRIRVNGVDLTKMTAKSRAAFRLREVGIVYQFGELLPELTLVENVALPALLRGTGRREAYRKGAALISELGLEAVADAATSTLSGGERQRVAVARALISEPTVVLADEPTGSLDRSGADDVCEMLFGLPKKYDCALVVVTHNYDVAVRADQSLVLAAGATKLSVTDS